MNTLILTPEAMFQGDLLLVNPSFPHHPLPHPDLVTVADTDILLERRAAQALDSLMAAIGGWKAVSYTHLDVYKRQRDSSPSCIRAPPETV